MEFASIEREIHVEAPPETVFEVISRPEHAIGAHAERLVSTR